MADGGSNDQLDHGTDNPFSFQKFVKKKGERGQVDYGDQDTTGDTIQMPDVSSTHSERTVFDGDGVENKTEKKEIQKNSDENPFSFKKFLKTSGSGSRPYRSRGQNSSSLNYASDLPDFVQDHYIENAQERFKDPLELPDFALDSPGLAQFGHRHSSRACNNHIDLDTDASLDEHRHLADFSPGLHLQNGADTERGDIYGCDADHADVKNGGAQFHVGSSLPDFLSDGAIITAANTAGPARSGYSGVTVQIPPARNLATFSVDGDVELELRRLREENEDLRHQLISQTSRLSQAQEEIARVEKRETEDTAALENMVHQVEANLVTTTKRAVQAESMVAKLKQELKSLQNQLTIAQQENKLLQSGDKTVLDIRERTKYASEQLSSAATNAEQTLRQLLSGVESMKVLSDVLASIDKVTEVDSTSTSSAHS